MLCLPTAITLPTMAVVVAAEKEDRSAIPYIIKSGSVVASSPGSPPRAMLIRDL